MEVYVVKEWRYSGVWCGGVAVYVVEGWRCSGVCCGDVEV